MDAAAKSSAAGVHGVRPSNIENLAFWSALNKKPAQMHRTKARGEEYLGGTWLVRLHELVELDTFSKHMLVGISPMHAQTCECSDVAVAFTPHMLSLK